MSEYFAKTEIDVPADDVFAYVTDISRMAEYLPTVKKATPLAENKIRVQGEVNGHSYDADGWYQIHEFERTMLWGSDGGNRYSGHLEVMRLEARSQLSVTLSFEPGPGMDMEFKELVTDRSADIQQGLERSVQSIREACEKAMAGTRHRSGYVL